ncbi:MAG: isoprenyl transferase [Desulfuromonadales bacterium]
MKIPRHLAVIMDGNGRWAERLQLPRISGHRRGVEIVREIVQECRQLGVEYLTLFAFSSENWRRPQAEVQALMKLLTTFLSTEIQNLCTNGVRLKVIGDRSRLPESVNQVLDDAIDEAKNASGMELILALSYGARDEQIRAVRTLAEQVAAGELTPGQIDEDLLARSLDTATVPDPDLLIRTSGEMRLSNFLLWQMAYTELYFSDVLWPEFEKAELHRAFVEFGRRERRFGKTAEQVGPSVTKETDH